MVEIIIWSVVLSVGVVVAAAIFAVLAGVVFKLFQVLFFFGAVLIAGVMLVALLPLLPTIVWLGLMALAFITVALASGILLLGLGLVRLLIG